jgi:hypothetical protein
MWLGAGTITATGNPGGLFSNDYIAPQLATGTITYTSPFYMTFSSAQFNALAVTTLTATTSATTPLLSAPAGAAINLRGGSGAADAIASQDNAGTQNYWRYNYAAGLEWDLGGATGAFIPTSNNVMRSTATTLTSGCTPTGYIPVSVNGVRFHIATCP